MSLTIAGNEAGQLTARLTGQPALLLELESPTVLHVVGVPAKLVFAAGGDTATGVTLHQGGQQLVFERVND